MARLARVVIPGHPHHVTQRGNGRARTFFGDSDYALYRDLLAENCRAADVEVWAWCLMPNHVHLILVPSDPDGLRRALARVHRAYAGIIQARRNKSGHFWQGRFGAVAMDEPHLAAALRYVALNPVRARLVQRAQDWRWSSTRAHVRGKDDGSPGALPRLRRTAGQRAGARSVRPPARRREHRPAARRRSLSRPPAAPDRTRPQASQTRAEAVRTGRGLSMVMAGRIECTVTVIAYFREISLRPT
ncbi:transposase [Bradyrhizobium septentrionale]|uniref:transposase n=1 Tax=Bradyrhizobium septentrionale TaxID=1404411 RepID=UPI001CCD96F0|nr:transposase [Bradyrhizobium septentrionale]UGY13539.1 transposase [Bradyrhizobium septentrionale]